MSGEIYLIRDDDELVELREHPYLTEEHLQKLLARHPRLLAGEQMDRENPRRWLLISRELSLPDAPDSGGRWSVDHLFLDQDGIPTLVEVKRSSDTRIRREVVGHMLDYAANAVLHWPLETLRLQFERTSTSRGADPEQVLMDHRGVDSDPTVFWGQVKTNLQAGRIRLLFVADVIPLELRRVVEFLNGQMSPAEVLAIELRQYVGEGLRTLVPSVIGQTGVAEQRKGSPREARQWDEPSFMATIEERAWIEGVRIVRLLLDWAKSRNLRFWWGRGKKDGSFPPDVRL